MCYCYGFCCCCCFSLILTHSVLLLRLLKQFILCVLHAQVNNDLFQMDLIHLGAKYAPCMRVDLNLEAAIELDRQEEAGSACCVRNDGSGCVQRVASQCVRVVSFTL